jgi:TRAP-type C4-dicarboxylate transport system permease small subunit
MLDKIERVVSVIEEYVCVGLIIVMCISVFAQVIFRYVLAVPLSWTEELSRYSMIWLTFIAGAMCIRSNSHYVIDILLKKLDLLPRLGLQLLILGGMAVFAGVMLYTGIEILPIINYQTSPALRISMGYIYLAIPFGAFLMVFHIICAIRNRIRCYKNPSLNAEALSENAH